MLEKGSTISKTDKDSAPVKDLEYKDKFLLSMWEAHSKKH